MTESYPGLRPGQVAAAAQVNLQTLRYYERRGLLDEPERSLGGHRLYPEDAVTLVRVIKVAQRLGFSLDEVALLLDAAKHRHQPGEGARMRQMAQDKLADVERRIADLQVIAEMLKNAIEAGCADLIECASIPDCPLPFSQLADQHQ